MQVTDSRTYVSPDGVLHFQVTHGHDGDIALGFEGFPWHTHGDLLVVWYGGAKENAAERFVEDLVQSRIVIVVVRRDGKTVDIRVTEDPQSDFRWTPDDVVLEFRYWDGSSPDGVPTR